MHVGVRVISFDMVRLLYKEQIEKTLTKYAV